MTAALSRVLTDPINALLAGRSSSARQIQAIVTDVNAELGMIDVQVPGLDADGNQILAPIYNVRCFGGLPPVGSTTNLLDTGQGRLTSLGVAGGGGGTIIVPGGSSRVLERWSALGYVWPHFTTIGTADDDGAITGVHVTVGLKPARELILDVQVAPAGTEDFASIFADPGDRPTFTSAQTNPLLALLVTPHVITAEDLFRVEWVDGGGAYDATAKVLG